MTSWNSGTPNLPSGFSDTVSRLAVNLANSAPGSSAAPTGATAITSTLTGLVKTQQFSPTFLLGAFLLSLALGCLHALTPGHGKALVGAYLVGSQGRKSDAVLLGGIVTITHTGSVLGLGLFTLVASHYILPALILPWLEVISGVLVIGFGINLLLQRRRDLALTWPSRKKTETNTAHVHGPEFAHDHPHSHHAHEPHDHSHNDEPHHEHAHTIAPGQVTLKSLLTLGISGGLVPCPDAIAILLVAVAINRIPFGMLLIVSFSIGLALILIAIGLAMVHGVRLIARSNWLSRVGVYAPLVSAVVVSGLGIGLTLNALNSFKFSTEVSKAPAMQPACEVALYRCRCHRLGSAFYAAAFRSKARPVHT
jgi:ABC-type nickel/cobalt efflux system permease component RcnA